MPAPIASEIAAITICSRPIIISICRFDNPIDFNTAISRRRSRYVVQPVTRNASTDTVVTAMKPKAR